MSDTQQRPNPACTLHGYAAMQGGVCGRCASDATKSGGLATWALPVLFAAAVIGVVVKGSHREDAPDTGHSMVVLARTEAPTAPGVVTERPSGKGGEPGAKAAAPVTSPATHAALDAWEVELAQAETKRAEELAAEDAQGHAADKARLEELLRTPTPRNLYTPQKSGHIWQYASEYGEQDWSGAPHRAAVDGKEFSFDIADEVTDSPEASSFIVVPLHVIILRSDTVPALSASPALEAQMPTIVSQVNRIWAAAGISLELSSVRVAAAESASFNPAVAKPTVDELRHAVPAWTRHTNGIRVYLIHDFVIYGVFYFGRGEAFVRETARSGHVQDGLDDAVARVMAHELGHGFHIDHVRTRTHLMAAGLQGAALGREEVLAARQRAETIDGARLVGSSEPPAAVTAVASQALRPWHTK